MSEPIPLLEWGARVLRPAREKSKLTRAQVANASGIAESTLRNIEAGRHLPTMRILVPLCSVVGLVNPLGDPEALPIRLEGIPRERAIDLLRAALRDFVTARADPKAYADRRFPQGGVLQLEAAHDAERDADDAGVLLASLRNHQRSSKP
jgi:transcriptional regulator with XRE-family HTH domain